ncbi:MAG: hypothetical protein AB7L92_08210 [Alphaproteobacteria bacterium]
MKSLKTLIKIHQHELDELRRIMVTLEGERNKLEAAVARLQQELLEEAEKAQKSPELARYYGDFARRIRQRQQQLREESRKIQKKIEDLREKISAAFSEVKKYEIALQNTLRREKEEQERKETIAMSELAIGQHLRKHDS